MENNTDRLADWEKEEEQSFYEDDFDQQPPPDIVAYNELRSCADLYRMYDREILDIAPDFQRDSVWNPASQTRFIDSLIKQLPIPSMCFSLDYKTQKWQVIDGLQRMTAIIRFLGDKDWRLSSLEDIDKRLSGKKVATFRDESSPHHILYQRLENLTLPITVIRCDYSKKSHLEYLFTIFHRLNTGGTKLNNQEIRNCIFSGKFNTLLKKELNENENWRLINRLNDKEDQRFKHVEIILRFFAFNDDLQTYKGNLSKFLNEYMRKHRNPDEAFLAKKKKEFEDTADIVSRILEPDERVGISTLEALMIGVSNNIDILKKYNSQELKNLYVKLKEHPSLSPDFLSGGVAKRDKVEARVEAAREIFGRQA